MLHLIETITLFGGKTISVDYGVTIRLGHRVSPRNFIIGRLLDDHGFSVLLTASVRAWLACLLYQRYIEDPVWAKIIEGAS